LVTLGLGGARTGRPAGLPVHDEGFSFETLELASSVNPIRAMNDETLEFEFLPEGGLNGGFFFGLFLLVVCLCACFALR
jgi:hypothetical protein